MCGMTGTGGSQRPEPDSSWHRRRPGIRYLYSVAAIIGGIILAIRWISQPGDATARAWLFVGAVTLTLLGLVSIPICRWMDKRRL
jgi:hypothetical protein